MDKEDKKFENKIEKILNEISEKDVRNLTLIYNDVKNVVTKLYDNYKMYPNNTLEKYKDILNRLKNGRYEWVQDLSEYKKKDIMYIVDASDFFDIKIIYIPRFYNYCSKRNILFTRNRANRHIYPNKKMLFFRKLNKKELFKILLIESIFEIENMDH